MIGKVINKASMKFVFGFLGILTTALVVLVVTSYVGNGKGNDTESNASLTDKL